MIKYLTIMAVCLCLIVSCSTDIDNMTEVDLTWPELLPEVQNGYIESLKPTVVYYGKSDSTIIYEDRLINLDSNQVTAKMGWINTGAGTGYNRFIINGKKFEDHSPAHGNKKIGSWVLHNRKLYFLRISNTSTIDTKEELIEAKFCYVNLNNVY